MEKNEFLSKALEFLNLKYNAGFGPFGSTSDPKLGKVEIQLYDKVRNHYAFIVEYKGIIERADSFEKIKKVKNFVRNRQINNRPTLLSIVFNTRLSEEDKKYFRESLKVTFNSVDEIFDFNDVVGQETDTKQSRKLYTVDDVRNLTLSMNDEPDETGLTNYEKIAHTSAAREASAELFLKEYERNFWWLNLNESFFPINEKLEGEIYRYELGETFFKRSLFNNIVPNDLAISFQTDNGSKIAGLFKVEIKTSSYIEFKLIQSLHNKLTWDQLSKIDQFEKSEVASKNANGALFPLEKNLFIEILKRSTSLFELIERLDIDLSENKASSLSSLGNNPSRIATINSDTIDGKDYFNLDPDITAFAKVIASSSFKPPLAIALFGKWGMGKSFFMNSLMEKITIYSKSQEKIDKPIYCRGISHIHFNAWSYMDANLWASIVSKIFEGLNEFIGNDNATETELTVIKEELSGKLQIIKEQRDLLELKRKENNERIKSLSNHKIEEQKLLNKKLSELKKNAISEVINTVNERFKVGEKINMALEEGVSQELKNKFDQFIPESYRQNPDLILSELNSNRLFVSTLLNKKNFQIFIFYAIGAILLALFLPFLIALISPSITAAATVVSQGIIALLAVVLPIWNSISNTFNELKPFIHKVWNIKIEYDQEVENVLRESHDLLKSIEIEIDLKKKEIDFIDRQIFEYNEENESINFQLNNNLSTLALNSFIEKRFESQDYQKQLGIVSMIRRDFEVLSNLFLKSRNEIKLKKPLDRIVLYIDDLDRCPEDRVIEVLEAVNLLMAFPLFVVVVGVDPRWVNNALLKKYHLQFGECTTEDYVRINASDYLEKIFQVPFHLKQAEDPDVKNMLKELTKGSVLIGNFSDSVDPEQNEYETSEMGDTEMSGTEMSMGGTTRYDEYRTANDSLEIDQYLSLRPEEVELMQDFSEIIGNNPRSIKRFVNIYQIVRAHEGLTIKADVEKKEFLAIMFLLGLSIGPYKLLFKEFEQYLNPPNTNMSKFLSSLKKEKSKYPELLKELDSKVRNMENSDDLIRIMTSEFKKHNKLIRRFTFSY